MQAQNFKQTRPPIPSSGNLVSTVHIVEPSCESATMLTATWTQKVTRTSKTSLRHSIYASAIHRSSLAWKCLAKNLACNMNKRIGFGPWTQNVAVRPFHHEVATTEKFLSWLNRAFAAIWNIIAALYQFFYNAAETAIVTETTFWILGLDPPSYRPLHIYGVI